MLEKTYNRVWDWFIARGFEYGQDHCVVAALKALLTALNPPQHIVCLLDHTARANDHPESKSLILINSQVSALSLDHVSTTMPAFKFHSLIAFEQLTERRDLFSNHFSVCASGQPHGEAFVYDGLLALKPGNHQGGLVPFGVTSVAHFFERVVLYSLTK